MKKHRLTCIFFGWLTILAGPWGDLSAAWAQGTVGDDLLTVAERSKYRATSRHAEVLELIDRLLKRSAQLNRLDFGQSTEQRPMVAVIAARPNIRSPEQARASDRLVVFLIGNIHSGECAGKEALLMLLRELALDPKHPLLEHLVLVVVPNYNPDGNERVGKNHRPRQLGPEQGMGRRENAQGLDLNRDFVKLDCPETRALVKLIDQWNPHLLIDTHTTNGSRHRYVLTYDVPNNPAAADGPRTFLRNTMLPEVTRQLEAKGLNMFFYGNLNSNRTRWTTYGHEPRYGIEYLGLRGRLAVLSEAYAYIPYKKRIEVTGAFLRECLSYVASNRQHIAKLLSQAEHETTAAGRNPQAGDEVAIRSRITAFPEKVTIKAFERQSRRTENGLDGRPKDYTVDYFGRFEPTLRVERPFAYLVPFEESRLADRLLLHGIRLEQLSADVSLDVEVYRVDKLHQARSSFQQHRLRTVEATLRREHRQVPAGTYLVPVGQPLGNLAVVLLEPASDDGLTSWNFLDHLLAPADDYPILRIPSAQKLPTKRVDQIRPAGRLDLEQIFGLARRVPLAGSVASARWIPGTSHYTMRIGDRQVRVDARTGATEPVQSTNRQMEQAFAALPGISRDDARRLIQSTSQRSSPDRKATLVSFANDLFIYRFGSDRAVRLTDSPEPEQYASFSPDGKLVGFVRQHNLYVVEIDSGRQRALTTEGTPELLHGELDWVYQEELYGRGNFRAYWWSPDSTRIALLRLDETPVRSYTVTDHIPYRGSLEVTRYPKAGDPLPRVTLGVVRVAGGPVRWVDTSKYERTEFLIVRVGWTPDSQQVVYQVQDRASTWLDLLTANRVSGASTNLLRETSPAWVEVLGEPRWLPDGSFLWLSDQSGNRHIFHVANDGQTTRPVTSGSWEVRRLHGVDPQEDWVYFSGTKDSAAGVHAYRVHLDGTGMERLTDREGSHTVRFNESYAYFIDSWSDVHTPAQSWLVRADGQLVRAIAPNLTDHLKYYRIGRPEFLELPNRDGKLLDAMLIKPPDFDPQRKYPVLCYVYSGPQAPVVRDRWGGSRYLWHQLLAQHGYCVWLCDNRSASSKGITHTWPIHGRLAELELKDLEDGIAWLKKQPWVDGARIGIWGWSYGGYMTSYALTHSKSFKIGIAGAPVTDWRNYDAIYTERYMGLPQDNPQGYSASSVVEAASQLHGRLLLIHGTTDDNVHLSNTLQLARELQRAGKQFDLMLYPRSRHGVTEPRQRRHLYELMTRFVLENL